MSLRGKTIEDVLELYIQLTGVPRSDLQTSTVDKRNRVKQILRQWASEQDEQYYMFCNVCDKLVLIPEHSAAYGCKLCGYPDRCSEIHPETGGQCTYRKGHEGPHHHWKYTAQNRG